MHLIGKYNSLTVQHKLVHTDFLASNMPAFYIISMFMFDVIKFVFSFTLFMINSRGQPVILGGDAELFKLLQLIKYINLFSCCSKACSWLCLWRIGP